MKDVLNLPAKTLGDFSRNFGKDWVIAYVSYWLIDLNDNSNVKQKMSDGQMEFTAQRIFEMYSLKVTDLTLFFRSVKEGKYGPFYENLSQDKIMNWLAQYWDERCEYAELSQQQKHDNFSLSKDKVHHEVVKKMFEGVGDEKASYEHETNGTGSRMKSALDNKSMSESIAAKYEKAYKMSDMELKDHIIKASYSDPDFDPSFYRIVETEMDRRLKAKSKTK